MQALIDYNLGYLDGVNKPPPCWSEDHDWNYYYPEFISTANKRACNKCGSVDRRASYTDYEWERIN